MFLLQKLLSLCGWQIKNIMFIAVLHPFPTSLITVWQLLVYASSRIGFVESFLGKAIQKV